MRQTWDMDTCIDGCGKYSDLGLDQTCTLFLFIDVDLLLVTELSVSVVKQNSIHVSRERHWNFLEFPWGKRTHKISVCFRRCECQVL